MPTPGTLGSCSVGRPGVLDDMMAPVLAANGYEHRRIRDDQGGKGSLGGELAIVWRADRLEDEKHASWKLCDLLDRPGNADILAAMERQPLLLAHMRRQPHMAQAIRFVERGNGPPVRRVTVLNTHLVQGDLAREQLRAIQACLLVREVRHWDETDAPLVLCGDLNTSGGQDEACMQLLGQGTVPPDHQCYTYGRRLGRPAQPATPPDDNATCTVAISDAGDVVCPNRCLPAFCGQAGDRLCWDHVCQSCGAPKGANFRKALCQVCLDAGRVADLLPADVGNQVLKCRLSIDGVGSPLRLVNVYEQLTGVAQIYEVNFHPFTGTPRRTRWLEIKDHIYLSAGLTAVRVAPGPAIESLGSLPSLTWPSDHMSYVADFRFSCD